MDIEASFVYILLKGVRKWMLAVGIRECGGKACVYIQVRASM